MPLEPIGDMSALQVLSRAHLPVLSSLADAPPLSSGGKNTPTVSKESKVSTGRRKLGTIGLDNIPDSKVTSVKLNAINATRPAAASTLQSDYASQNNISRKNESMVKNSREQYIEDDLRMPTKGQRNMKLEYEDDMSEAASRLSYGDTDYEEEMEEEYYPISGDEAKYNTDSFPLSPMHNLGSPEPIDVNAMVVLGAKPTENKRKVPNLAYNSIREFKPLAARKLGSHEKLKPIVTKKSNKKPVKKSPKGNEQVVVSTQRVGDSLCIETSPKVVRSEKTTQDSSAGEQASVLRQIREKWQERWEEVENEGKLRYEKLQSDWEATLEEEETKLRKEHEVSCQNFKNQMAEERENEEKMFHNAVEKLEKTYKEKLSFERHRFEQEFEDSIASLKQEIEEKEKKKYEEIEEKKALLDEEYTSAIQELRKNHGKRMEEVEGSQNQEPREMLHNFSEVENFESRLSEVKKLVDSEEKSLQQLQREVCNLQIEKESMAEETKEFERQIKIEKHEMELLEKERKLIQDDMDELQDEAEKLEDDLDLLRIQKTNLCIELNHLKSEITDRSSALKEGQQNQVTVSESDKHSCNKKDFADKEVFTEIVFIDASCQIENIWHTYDSKSVQVEIASSNKTLKSSVVQTVLIDVLERSSQTDAVKLSVADAFSQTVTSYEISKDSSFSSHLQMSSQTMVAKSNYVDAFSQTTLSHQSLSHNPYSDNSHHQNTVFTGKSGNIDDILSRISSHFESRFTAMEHYIKLLEDKIDINPQSPHSTEPLLHRDPSNLQENGKYFFHSDILDYSDVPYSASDTKSIFHSDSQNVYLPSQVVASCACESGETCEILQNLKHSLVHLNQQLQQPFFPYLKDYDPSNIASSRSYHEQLHRAHEKMNRSREKRSTKVVKPQNDHEAPVSFTESAPNLAHHPTFPNISFNEQLPHASLSHPYANLSIENELLARARDVINKEKVRTSIQRQALVSRTFSHSSKDPFTSQTGGRDERSTLFAQKHKSTSVFPSTHYSLPVPYGSSLQAQCVSCDSQIFSEHYINDDYHNWMSRIRGMQQRIQKHGQSVLTSGHKST